MSARFILKLFLVLFHDVFLLFLQVPAVVEALVLKYVALTHEELEEWSSDPEGYIR
jgi:hypothetical protein